MFVITVKSPAFGTGYFNGFKNDGYANWQILYNNRARQYKTRQAAEIMLRLVKATPQMFTETAEYSVEPAPAQYDDIQVFDPNFENMSLKNQNKLIGWAKQMLKERFATSKARSNLKAQHHDFIVEPHDDIEVDVRSIRLKAGKPFSINHVRELHGLEMVDNPMYEELL